MKIKTFRFYRYLLVSVVAALCSATAGAVYLNPNGTGQALIYPYFSAQSISGSGFNTYISLANTTPQSKVMRVRFREGRHGRELASFNLYLTGGGMWAGAVVPTSGGARLITVDKSCVNPAFQTDAPGSNIRVLEFSNTAFTGANADNLGTGADRMREGYIEVIEMASLAGNSAANIGLPPNDLTATTPANCAAVQGAQVTLETAVPTGGLSGTLTVINVANGLNFTVNADALAELSTTPFYRDISDPYPDFNASEVSPVSTFTLNGKMYRATWNTGLEAIESALMKGKLENEIILDSSTNSHTDWVVTLPMLRFHDSQQANRPITYPPTSVVGVPTEFSFRPRDGFSLTLASCTGLCPPQTFETIPALPWASSVVSFARTQADRPSWSYVSNSSVMGSANALSLLLSTPAENGSATMDLRSGKPQLALHATSIRVSDGVVGNETATMFGAPVVGFMVRTFQNGQLSCGSAVCQGNYGGAYPHKSQGPTVQ